MVQPALLLDVCAMRWMLLLVAGPHELALQLTGISSKLRSPILDEIYQMASSPMPVNK